MPVRFVHVGGLASQYGMVWTTWMHGIREIGPMRTTVFASVLALSSPWNLVQRRTFCLVILCWNPTMQFPYGCDDEFVWDVVLGAPASYVVVYKIYVVDNVHKHVYFMRGVFSVG